ncbi:MAG TPA: hypothetical protein DCP92_20100 [Nitrospiraceae bacterium]|nr:hypothetical protein [Nitrospiraceae bacterium]
MEGAINKKRLVEELLASHASWEALLDQVGPDRMELRGVVGEWSVKDLVAHASAWEWRAVAHLKAILAKSWPEPPEWPYNLDESGINAWIFAANRRRRLSDVLNESRQVFEQLMQVLEPVTEEDLTKAGRFGWLGHNSEADYIRGNSIEHYQEHGQQIREWLDER